MRNLKKTLAIVFAFLMVASVMTSCTKKGTGCPNNFSISISK